MVFLRLNEVEKKYGRNTSNVIDVFMIFSKNYIQPPYTYYLYKVQIWLLYIDLELQSIPVLIDVTQIKFDVECNPLAKNELQCATLMCIAGLSFPEPLLQSLDLHSSLNSCVFVTRIITLVTIKQYIPNSSSQR